MKHEKISIKWKLFVYLISFTGILLVLLWLFQTVYLDSFYKIIKKRELSDAAQIILDNLDEEDLQSTVEQVAKEYDLCILISDSQGNELYTAETLMNCSIHRLTTEDFAKCYGEAVEAGGKAEIEFEDGRSKKPFEKPSYMPEEKVTEDKEFNPFPGAAEKENPIFMKNSLHGESVIRVYVEEVEDEEWVIMLNSVLTPVDATVQTIRVQLVCISVILILLSLLIALLISKQVSKSIIRVNASAKQLAKGNYDVGFEGKDYREIAELSDTLNYTAQELAKAEDLQRELIANVSHDLRTPLTMITAYAEVMRDLPGENTPENVQVVIDEAKRLTGLVNDLLDLSKLQAGVMEKETKVYDLTDSIEKVMERYAKLKEQDGYSITFEYSEHVMVEADEFKIFQVLYNLINNAINYTGDDKKVTVRQIANGTIVRIEVSDTGQGIAEKELPYVWERYYKVDKTHKRAVKGTGLGLSIVKNILKLHDARYGVESKVGKGSTFWFELRVKEDIKK